MSSTRPNIIVVYQMDPFGDGQGGGVRYVTNVLEGTKGLCNEILFLGIGKTPRSQGSPVVQPVTSTITTYPVFLFFLIWKLLTTNLDKYTVVHVHRSYYAIPFLLLKPGIKTVATLHGRTFSVFEQRFGSVALRSIRPLFSAIEKFALKRLDYIVPVSPEVDKVFAPKYPELWAEKKKSMKMLGTIIDFSAFTPEPCDILQRKYGANCEYLIFVGRLYDVKNVDFLIDLFGKHYQTRADRRLVIVGAGVDKQKLQEQASRVCPNNAPIFEGEISAADIPSYLRSASVLLVCSHHEGSPTIMKEGLACGLPLVSNDVGEVADYIVNGKNGYMVEKSHDAFYRAIEALLEKRLSRDDVFSFSSERLKTSSLEYIGEQYFQIYKHLSDAQNT